MSKHIIIQRFSSLGGATLLIFSPKPRDKIPTGIFSMGYENFRPISG